MGVALLALHPSLYFVCTKALGPGSPQLCSGLAPVSRAQSKMKTRGPRSKLIRTQDGGQQALTQHRALWLPGPPAMLPAPLVLEGSAATLGQGRVGSGA